MTVEYRRLGSSDVTISAITLGGQRSEQGVSVALECGITSFDTAPVYGFGRGEERLGQAIAGRRDRVQVLTKFGLRWDCEGGEYWLVSHDDRGQGRRVYKNSTPPSVIWECEQSLRRLGTDYIDLYMCHWRDHTTPIEETMAALETLLKAGKIRAVGVSNWEVDEIEAARRVLPIASDQVRFNMLDRRAEEAILPCCRRLNIGVIAYSPLERGLLSGTVTMERQFPAGDGRAEDPLFRSDNRRRLLDFFAALAPLAATHGATPGQLVLNWTIHQPGLAAALAGAQTPAQIRENAGAGQFTLSDEEMQQIDAALANVKLER